MVISTLKQAHWLTRNYCKYTKFFFKTWKSVLSTDWTAESESRKVSYPQQAEAKPQYHPPKCEGIESDCKEHIIQKMKKFQDNH